MKTKLLSLAFLSLLVTGCFDGGSKSRIITPKAASVEEIQLNKLSKEEILNNVLSLQTDLNDQGISFQFAGFGGFGLGVQMVLVIQDEANLNEDEIRDALYLLVDYNAAVKKILDENPAVLNDEEKAIYLITMELAKSKIKELAVKTTI